MADVRVWLDDERDMPIFYNVHVKTAEEVISLIIAGSVTHISLDHDLGTMRTGYDVAKYIEQHAYNGGYRFGVQIHTQNVVGKKNMTVAIHNAMRYWIAAEQTKADIIQVDDSPSAWFAIMALCLNKRMNGGELLEAPDGQLKIELIVNGKHLSFVETVGELYNRLTQNIQEQAAEIANKQIQDKFKKLQETATNATALIRNKVFESFGVDVGAD